MSHEVHEQNMIHLKVILVGDSGVGKTNLINVATNGEFNDLEKITTIASYVVKEIEVDGVNFRVNLWDTIGQEKMRSITKLFFVDSKIVFIVYDITNRVTFQSLNYWLDQVRDTLDLDKIVIGICGNKSDLAENEEVKKDECKQFAENIGVKWSYTSAKNDKEGFLQFLKDLIREYMKKNEIKSDENEKLNIEYNNLNEEKNRSCC